MMMAEYVILILPKFLQGNDYMRLGLDFSIHTWNFSIFVFKGEYTLNHIIWTASKQ